MQAPGRIRVDRVETPTEGHRPGLPHGLWAPADDEDRDLVLADLETISGQPRYW
jgi:hypothetical protein